MPRVKDLTMVAAKWNRRASSAAGEYTEGVKTTPNSWEANAKAAEGSYEQGVTASIGRKAFGKGIAAAGNEKWKGRSAELGSQRYPGGVAAAQPEFEKGWGPFRAVIEGTTLPPRGPKGTAGNYNRSTAMGTALAAAKRR